MEIWITPYLSLNKMTIDLWQHGVLDFEYVQRSCPIRGISEGELRHLLEEHNDLIPYLCL